MKVSSSQSTTGLLYANRAPSDEGVGAVVTQGRRAIDITQGDWHCQNPRTGGLSPHSIPQSIYICTPSVTLLLSIKPSPQCILNAVRSKKALSQSQNPALAEERHDTLQETLGSKKPSFSFVNNNSPLPCVCAIVCLLLIQTTSAHPSPCRNLPPRPPMDYDPRCVVLVVLLPPQS